MAQLDTTTEMMEYHIMDKETLLELCLGEIIIALPDAGKLFRSFNIDWFKNHQKNIEEIFEPGSTQYEEVLNKLLEINQEKGNSINWLKESSVTVMTQHIVNHYHKPERAEIIRLWKALKVGVDQLQTEAPKEVAKLKKIQKGFRFFREEFILHMDHEEKELFSMLEKMDIYPSDEVQVPSVSFGAISKPLNGWENEHEIICKQIADLDAQMPNTCHSCSEPKSRHLYSDIQTLLCSIRQHVNFEDVILEPAAYKLEQAISL